MWLKWVQLGRVWYNWVELGGNEGNPEPNRGANAEAVPQQSTFKSDYNVYISSASRNNAQLKQLLNISSPPSCVRVLNHSYVEVERGQIEPGPPFVANEDIIIHLHSLLNMFEWFDQSNSNFFASILVLSIVKSCLRFGLSAIFLFHLKSKIEPPVSCLSLAHLQSAAFNSNLCLQRS